MMENRTTRRHGLTLVELLVVIIIISTLVATVIPLMVPTVEARRVREAARGVSTFISGARARALELGRPVGVMIERLPAENGAGVTLSYVEVPAAFSGFTSDAAIVIQSDGPPNAYGYYSCKAFLPPGSIPLNFIRVFDTLRVNHQGFDYQITGPDTNGDSFVDVQPNFPVQLLLRVFVGPQGALPWSDTQLSGPMPFEIFRQPQRTAAAPFQLPDGAAIDLSASGVDDDVLHDLYAGGGGPKKANDNSFPITFLFGTTGTLHQLIHNEGLDIGVGEGPEMHRERLTATLHLLIGKRENIPPPEAAQATGAPETANWMDPENVWVSVGHISGQVTTSPVAPQVTGAPDMETQLAESRRFAAEMRSMGTP